MRCPFCKYDLLLESKVFENEDSLPKIRYLQAYVKYLKIKKLAETKEYKNRLRSSGIIGDLIKDCLSDMTISLELKYGKRFDRKNRHNPFWNSWMDELAKLRNHAIHKMTAVAIKKIFEADGKVRTSYHLRAEPLKGDPIETEEEVLPYFEKTLEKIKEKMGIKEI
jgi:hypothetical protein